MAHEAPLASSVPATSETPKEDSEAAAPGIDTTLAPDKQRSRSSISRLIEAAVKAAAVEGIRRKWVSPPDKFQVLRSAALFYVILGTNLCVVVNLVLQGLVAKASMQLVATLLPGLKNYMDVRTMIDYMELAPNQRKQLEMLALLQLDRAYHAYKFYFRSKPPASLYFLACQKYSGLLNGLVTVYVNTEILLLSQNPWVNWASIASLTLNFSLVAQSVWMYHRMVGSPGHWEKYRWWALGEDEVPGYKVLILAWIIDETQVVYRWLMFAFMALTAGVVPAACVLLIYPFMYVVMAAEMPILIQKMMKTPNPVTRAYLFVITQAVQHIVWDACWLDGGPWSANFTRHHVTLRFLQFALALYVIFTNLKYADNWHPTTALILVTIGFVCALTYFFAMMWLRISLSGIFETKFIAGKIFLTGVYNKVYNIAVPVDPGGRICCQCETIIIKDAMFCFKCGRSCADVKIDIANDDVARNCAANEKHPWEESLWTGPNTSLSI